MKYPYVDEENGWVYFNENTIVVNEDVEMRWHGMNKKYYIALGYECSDWKESFYVDIKDLSKGSHAKISVICPMCSEHRKVVFRDIIKVGHSKCLSCAKIIDRRGKVYGRWTVLEQDGQYKYGHAMWVCKCECGTIKTIFGDSLENGDSKSCKCLQREIMSGRSGKNSPTYKHTLSDLERESFRSSEDKQWAYKIKELDNFTCQCCGDDKGGNLVSHHLNKYKDFPEQRTDLNNGITLCKTCHSKFHSWMGSTSVTCTHEDFTQFCKEFYPNALFII